MSGTYIPLNHNRLSEWVQIEANWREAGRYFQEKYDRAYPLRHRLEMLDADLALCYLRTHGFLRFSWTEDGEIVGIHFDESTHRKPGGPIVQVERSARLSGKSFDYARDRFYLLSGLIEAQFADDLPVIAPNDAWAILYPMFVECVPKRYRQEAGELPRRP